VFDPSLLQYFLAYFRKKHYLALKAQNTFTKFAKNDLKAFKVTYKVQLVELQGGLGVLFEKKVIKPLF